MKATILPVTAMLGLSLIQAQAQTNLPIPKCPAGTQAGIVKEQSQTKMALPPVLERTLNKTVTTIQCLPLPPAPPTQAGAKK